MAPRARAAERDRTAAGVDRDRADVRKGRDRASRTGIRADRMIAVGVVSEANMADRVDEDCIRVRGAAGEAVPMASGSARRPTRLSIIRARPT